MSGTCTRAWSGSSPSTSADLMLLVVTGAGASYDSLDPEDVPNQGYDFSWRVPLTSELFDHRKHTFGPILATWSDCVPLAQRLRRAVREKIPLEEEMERIDAAESGHPLGQRQLTALRMYLQETLWESGHRWAAEANGATHYLELVDRLRKWSLSTGQSVTFVTFNYDTMLDRAGGFDIPTPGNVSLDRYTSDETFRLFKLHGSVNWGRIVNHTPPPNLFFSNARRYVVQQAPALLPNPSDEYVLQSSLETLIDPTQETHLTVPALALPTATKDRFECPRPMVDQLVASLDKVKAVLVVGWRGQEEEFVKLLIQHGPKDLVVTVVTGATHRSETVATMERVFRTPWTRREAEGFTGFLADKRMLEQVFIDHENGPHQSR